MIVLGLWNLLLFVLLALFAGIGIGLLLAVIVLIVVRFQDWTRGE